MEQPAGSRLHSRNSGRFWSDVIKSVAIALVVLCCLVGTIGLCLSWLPKLTDDEASILWSQIPPNSIARVKTLRGVLLKYSKQNPVLVRLALCLSYVTMQTFALPGTAFLSILSGALYGSVYGLGLVAIVSTIGSCMCYLLSWNIGKPLAHALWPEKLDNFSLEVEKRRQQLLNYVIFLRVTPVLPNTFINIASPIVGVPLLTFTVGTFLGCLPNNFVAVNAGNHLSEIHSLADLYDVRMVIVCLGMAAVAITPIFLSKKKVSTPKQE